MKTMKIIPFDIALREQIQSEENHYQGRYKVQTRNGDDVKIIYWDKRDRISREYSIVGLQTINDTEFITTCTKDGKFSLNTGPSNNDLVLIDTWEPELKESEDERVRKAILGLVYLDGIEPILTKCSVTRSDILSYLEKQKEQKPVEWSEEDENNTGWLIAFLEGKIVYHSDNLHKSVIKWLRGIRDRLKSLHPQPKVEWSDDDYHWEGLVRLLRNYQKTIDRSSNNMAYESVECYIEWLKSLRLSQKQEWSEEDEKIRKELINWLNGKTTYEWTYEWCENKDRWITYLEKRKEQKPMEWSDDIIRRGIKEVGLTQYQINWLKNNVFPPKEEQKPVEWGEDIARRVPKKKLV